MLLLPSASQSIPRGSHASKLNSRWQRQGTWVLKTPFSRGQRPKAPQEHRYSLINRFPVFPSSSLCCSSSPGDPPPQAEPDRHLGEHQ